MQILDIKQMCGKDILLNLYDTNLKAVRFNQRQNVKF